MLHRVGLAPTISVHARWEVIAGSSRALLIKLPVHGAGERARTVNLLITNQLHYQLSYTSTLGEVVASPGAIACSHYCFTIYPRFQRAGLVAEVRLELTTFW